MDFFPFFRFEILRGLDEIGCDDAAKVLNCKHYFHSVACSWSGSGLTVDDSSFMNLLMEEFLHLDNWIWNKNVCLYFTGF